MKAVFFDTFGGSDVLKTGTLPDPVPGTGEVLIRISHTSLNPVDWKIREGYLKDFLPHQFPIVPGWDAAGIVESVGADITDMKAGDKVYAYARTATVQSGTYAEKIVLPRTSVALAPSKVSVAEAAAIPLTALTAWQGIHENLQVRAGDTILITAGAGGVGSFAVQFARLAGARVVTTASGRNHEYLKALGADLVIDYTKEDVAAKVRSFAPDGVDSVYDAAGGKSLLEAATLLKANGRLVSIVDDPQTAVKDRTGIQASYLFVRPEASQLENVAQLIDAGKVQLPAIEVFSVTEAAALQDESRKGHTRGKVVLAIDFH
jgi:NADPH2:quinone reductase